MFSGEQWQIPIDSLGLMSLVFGISIAAILYTHSISYVRSAHRTQNGEYEPPLLPYWIPFLQHLPAFLLDPTTLYEAGRSRFSGKPFTILLAGTRFHVFFSPDTVNHVFSKSRLFSFDPVMASMMENGVDLPPPDRPKFLSSTTNRVDGKFLTENHNIWTRYLSGKRLKGVMDIYMSSLPSVLHSNLDLSSDKWQKKNLYPFLRKVIFETSVRTFFGPRLVELWPTIWDDWRRFDDATYIGVRSNWAFKLQPKTYKARERMFQAFERWMDAAEDFEWKETEEIWCESWGLRLNLDRDVLGRQCGFTKRGRACLHASFLFVYVYEVTDTLERMLIDSNRIITNAAPMATWFAYCAASNHSRSIKYRAAITPFILSSTIVSDLVSIPHFDLPALIKDPFIHSLWLEALRLGTMSAAARVVTQDTVLEGYLLQKGSVVLMPVHLMHFGNEFHPDVKQFQPERWLVADEEKLKRQRALMRPFGGGTSLCSGRFVAEMEIVGIVSVLLGTLDIKLEDHEEGRWEFNPRSIGVMAPKKDIFVWVKIRGMARIRTE